MKRSINSISITLWAARGVAMLLTVLLFTMPVIMNWYSDIRTLTELARISVLAAFYACSVPVYLALWQMDLLLRCLQANTVFVQENVRRIRIIQWCCGGICLICIPAAIAYYPLVFMVVIMGFLCLVISVLCRVMEKAVAIREENDLTI